MAVESGHTETLAIIAELPRRVKETTRPELARSNRHGVAKLDNEDGPRWRLDELKQVSGEKLSTDSVSGVDINNIRFRGKSRSPTRGSDDHLARNTA